MIYFTGLGRGGKDDKVAWIQIKNYNFDNDDSWDLSNIVNRPGKKNFRLYKLKGVKVLKDMTKPEGG